MCFPHDQIDHKMNTPGSDEPVVVVVAPLVEIIGGTLDQRRGSEPSGTKLGK